MLCLFRSSVRVNGRPDRGPRRASTTLRCGHGSDRKDAKAVASAAHGKGARSGTVFSSPTHRVARQSVDPKPSGRFSMLRARRQADGIAKDCGIVDARASA